MSENQEIKIIQKSALGMSPTQIGVQNNYGITIQDATQMAFEIFEQYYPQLRTDILDEVRTLVKEELERKAPENIKVPTAKIILPAMQNASITEDVNLKKMYAKLIASDMQTNKIKMIHPAFVDIINQMSCNDAILFSEIVGYNNSIPLARITFVFDEEYLTHVMPHFFSPVLTSLSPEEISISIENLSRLGVMNLFEGSITGYSYDSIKTHPYVQDRFTYAKEHNPERNLKINLSKYVIQMNDFGRNFANVCIE